jgi:hypothetical protein
VITAQLDYTEFVRRANALRTEEARAREEAARDGTSAAMRHVFSHARRDTRRFVRGWSMANNMAGLPSLPVPAVKESNYADKYLEILGDQIDTFSARAARLDMLIESRFRRTGRPMRGRYYNELGGDLQRTLVRLEKAREQLREAARRHELNIPDYLFVGVFNYRGQYVSMKGAKTKGKTARQLATIRTKVYGGYGRRYHSEEGTYYVLHNLEPHTTLVERRDRVVAEAMVIAKMMGVRRINETYTRGIRRTFG